MNARVDHENILAGDCYDFQDPDRVSFMDAQNVYIEFGELVHGKRVAKPGEVAWISRDELGWVAGVQTQHHFTLDYEFPTLRLALDFALTRGGMGK